MANLPLAKHVAVVLGVERPDGRKVAVGLAEAGATVAAVTVSQATEAEFAANSAANEFWALGRPGIALTTDGGVSAVNVAMEEAALQLGAVSIVVLHTHTALPREALAGLRSDPAIIVLVSDDADVAECRALLGWTRELAAAGFRANALVATRGTAERGGPTLKEHHAPEQMGVAQGAVYLASDLSAAVEGAMVVAG